MIARHIATVGGVGYLPMAPGTFGSLAAIPLTWALHAAGGFALVAAATIAVTVAGWWASREMLAGAEDDPSEIVIDEVAGMMVALWPLSLGLTMMGAGPDVFPWPGWVLGFVLFRFFDIVKPPPVRWFDRPGPVGIMADDLVAGGLTALIATIAAGVAHGWI